MARLGESPLLQFAVSRTTKRFPNRCFRAFLSGLILARPQVRWDLRLFPLFRALPQGTSVVHRFRTASPNFAIAEFCAIGESAFTAGVNDTLPVIAQGWFCGSFPESKLEAEPDGPLRAESKGISAEAVPKACKRCGHPGVAASSETVSHSGTATIRVIGCKRAFGCGLRHRRRSRSRAGVVRNVGSKPVGMRGSGSGQHSRSEYGLGGWPGPYFFVVDCLLSSSATGRTNY